VYPVRDVLGQDRGGNGGCIQQDKRLSKSQAAGKGGVGKSTVTVLVARVLRAKGNSVIVLDTDESNAGLLNLFGFQRGPKSLISLLARFSSGDSAPDVEWLRSDKITTTTIPSEYVLDVPGLVFMMTDKIQDPFQGCSCSVADRSRHLIGKL
jgi:CO dehydrogenase maturation factor